jgi:hypothetical protein
MRIQHKSSTTSRATKMATAQNESRHRVTTTASFVSGENRTLRNRFLLTHHAGVDDIDGKGFDHPSGIQIAKCNGGEFLYVGDSGNQRIVKFRISQREELPR